MHMYVYIYIYTHNSVLSYYRIIALSYFRIIVLSYYDHAYHIHYDICYGIISYQIRSDHIVSTSPDLLREFAELRGLPALDTITCIVFI